nr:ABC transporter permease [Murinocardiopsis flavida]
MLARIGQGPVAVDEERRALNVAAPGGGDYRAFLMPGMFVMTAVTSVTAITGAVCQDKAEGIMDRFRSLPMSRLAVPIGHTVADLIGFLPSLAVMVGAGYLIGWRAQNGWAAAIAAFGLILLLRYALSWAGTWLGLLFTDPQAAFRLTPLVFPATMLANTFVPTEGMPAALRVIADYNPVSAATAACRALFGNPGAGVGDALPLQYPITATVLWSALLLAVFVPLSARRYGRR